MAKMKHDEPNLNDIDDFNDKESDEKRNTVKLVIVLILIVGAILTYFRSENRTVDEYVGTKDKPGMDVTKGKY